MTNLHIRGADHQTVVSALRSLHVVPAYVRGSFGNPWISIFPEAAEQDEVALAEMAAKLSKTLERPVIAFIVHDSDIFLYWLYNNGREIDRYNSAPGFFTGKDVAPEGGDAEMLSVCKPPGLSNDRLSHLLHPERVALTQPEGQQVGNATKIKDALRKKLIESYPALAAKIPNLPSLEVLLAAAERRSADMLFPHESEHSAVQEHVFAEDLATELARLLEMPDGSAIGSYQYLLKGEGSSGSYTFLNAEDEKLVELR